MTQLLEREHVSPGPEARTELLDRYGGVIQTVANQTPEELQMAEYRQPIYGMHGCMGIGTTRALQQLEQNIAEMPPAKRPPIVFRIDGVAIARHGAHASVPGVTTLYALNGASESHVQDNVLPDFFAQMLDGVASGIEEYEQMSETHTPVVLIDNLDELDAKQSAHLQNNVLVPLLHRNRGFLLIGSKKPLQDEQFQFNSRIIGRMENTRLPGLTDQEIHALYPQLADPKVWSLARDVSRGHPVIAGMLAEYLSIEEEGDAVERLHQGLETDLGDQIVSYFLPDTETRTQVLRNALVMEYFNRTWVQYVAVKHDKKSVLDEELFRERMHVVCSSGVVERDGQRNAYTKDPIAGEILTAVYAMQQPDEYRRLHALAARYWDMNIEIEQDMHYIPENWKTNQEWQETFPKVFFRLTESYAQREKHRILAKAPAQ